MKRTKGKIKMWNWLVAQGLYHDLVSACVLVPILKVTSSRFAKRLAHEIALEMRKVFQDAESEIEAVKKDLDNVA
jgi:hypothetical protein